MFLKKDNSIKWKWLLVGALITAVLIVFCMSWFDVFFISHSYNFDLESWNVLEHIFDPKVWLFVTAIWAGAGFIKMLMKSKKSLLSNLKYKNLKKHISKNKGALVFISVFMASLIGYVLKFGIGRQRPVFFEALGQTGYNPFVNSWGFHSMPSGHAIVSFAGLVMIGMLYPKLKPYTWTVAIFIGLSRVLSGYHFPSDVLLGAFLGLVIADLVKSFFCKR